MSSSCAESSPGGRWSGTLGCCTEASQKEGGPSPRGGGEVGGGGERKGDKVCQGYLLMEDYGTVYGSRGSYVHHTADSKQKSLKLCLLLD